MKSLDQAKHALSLVDKILSIEVNQRTSGKYESFHHMIDAFEYRGIWTKAAVVCFGVLASPILLIQLSLISMWFVILAVPMSVIIVATINQIDNHTNKKVAEITNPPISNSYTNELATINTTLHNHQIPISLNEYCRTFSFEQLVETRIKLRKLIQLLQPVE